MLSLRVSAVVDANYVLSRILFCFVLGLKDPSRMWLGMRITSSLSCSHRVATPLTARIVIQ